MLEIGIKGNKIFSLTGFARNVTSACKVGSKTYFTCKALPSRGDDTAICSYDQRVLVLGNKRSRDIRKDWIDMQYLRPDKSGESDIQFFFIEPSPRKWQPLSILHLF